MLTADGLRAIIDSMPDQERTQVVAAVAEWEAVKAKHGDAGALAFALVALTFELEKTA